MLNLRSGCIASRSQSLCRILLLRSQSAMVTGRALTCPRPRSATLGSVLWQTAREQHKLIRSYGRIQRVRTCERTTQEAKREEFSRRGCASSTRCKNCTVLAKSRVRNGGKGKGKWWGFLTDIPQSSSAQTPRHTHPYELPIV